MTMKSTKHKKWKILLAVLVGVPLLLFVILMLLPKGIENPVEGCGKGSYNPNAFWHPWGDHNHRGIDIFAKKGTTVHPAIGGIVLATGKNGLGGNYVIVFSSGCRLHYYAHLDKIETHVGAIVSRKSVIGKVGNTGNAAKTPSHLHYSISSPIPQGDCHFDPKIPLFYINPIKEMKD